MATMTVTKVGVLSIGKLVGTVNLIVGLAIGLIAAIAATVTYFNAGSYGFLEGLLGALAIILTAVILYPLLMFALGWLYGVLMSFIFNVVIGVSGGVELTVETAEDEKPAKK